MSEPVLLVGETGVGKTATINYLAQVTGNQHSWSVTCMHSLFKGWWESTSLPMDFLPFYNMIIHIHVV